MVSIGMRTSGRTELRTIGSVFSPTTEVRNGKEPIVRFGASQVQNRFPVCAQWRDVNPWKAKKSCIVRSSVSHA